MPGGASMIEIVSATRLPEQEFWRGSALGVSLRRLASDGRLTPRVTFANSASLPAIYNARITATNPAEFVVFMHDDVWIDDYFLADRIIAGLGAFDVIGIAGNRRRAPGQRAWHFVSAPGQPQDQASLSGSIAHGRNPFGRVSTFGPLPAECELLDGVFLATRLRTLLEHSVRFDPLFDFHFYDLDFCRSARSAGLHLGTWPVCLTHQSNGQAFESPAWMNAYAKYLKKWGA